MKEPFRKIAHLVSNAAGSPWAFCLAVLVLVAWAISGPVFDFSNTWQLVINTCTTIITFLMVFLIQNTQNRDGRAMQLKLDELIRATRARDTFIDLEDMSDEDLAVITAEFQKMHDRLDNPALKEFHKKLEAAHSRRKRSNPSIADQVVSILNTPILPHDQDKK